MTDTRALACGAATGSGLARRHALSSVESARCAVPSTDTRAHQGVTQ